MMRGDSIPKPDLPIENTGQTSMLVPTRRKNRLVAANIVDPRNGEVQYHIVSTKFLNIMIASIVTLLLCGIVVLALVVYLKTDIDQNKIQIENLKREVPNDTP